MQQNPAVTAFSRIGFSSIGARDVLGRCCLRSLSCAGTLPIPLRILLSKSEGGLANGWPRVHISVHPGNARECVETEKRRPLLKGELLGMTVGRDRKIEKVRLMKAVDQWGANDGGRI